VSTIPPCVFFVAYPSPRGAWGRSRASIGAPSAATGEAGPQAEALAWAEEASEAAAAAAAAKEAEEAAAAEAATERAGSAWGSTAFRAISRPFLVGPPSAVRSCAHRRAEVARVQLGDHGSSITVASIGVPAGGQ
jgi:hypothetical protein